MERPMDAITTEAIGRAVDGDRASLERLLGTLERPFYNLALRMALQPHDAEDATQECLIRVATRLAQFDGRARFSTWAWRVAVHCILDFREGRLRRPMVSFEQFGAKLADGLDLEAPERADDRITLGELKMRCGRALLQCLDGDHRIAFVLGEILEFEGPEAGEILEIDAATFRKRLSRAREHLQEALRANCGLVNPDAPCRCHRRLARARQLGRVPPDQTTEQPLELAALRARLAGIDVALRAAQYYRADPGSLPRRELMRAALEPFSTHLAGVRS
jgi:RNA polymerase sigma factor (sigma-70 family)